MFSQWGKRGKERVVRTMFSDNVEQPTNQSGVAASACNMCDARNTNGVKVFLYCQIEGAVSDETVTLARQQSTDLFYFSKVNVVPL